MEIQHSGGTILLQEFHSLKWMGCQQKQGRILDPGNYFRIANRRVWRMVQTHFEVSCQDRLPGQDQVGPDDSP